MKMNIQEPTRKPFYCYLTTDTKDGLTQLAKYHKTTLTHLMEEGAQMVIRSRLKQLDNDVHNARQVGPIMDNFSW